MELIHQEIMKNRTNPNFVICIRNEEYPASLEVRKIYESLPDKTAKKYQQIRVIDESGEDYLYPADYFVSVKLPKATENVLVKTT